MTMKRMYMVLTDAYVETTDDPERWHQWCVVGIFDSTNKMIETINKIKRQVKDEHSYVDTNDIVFDILEVRYCPADYTSNINDMNTIVYYFENYTPFSEWFHDTYDSYFDERYDDCDDDDDDAIDSVTKEMDILWEKHSLTTIHGITDEPIVMSSCDSYDNV